MVLVGSSPPDLHSHGYPTACWGKSYHGALLQQTTAKQQRQKTKTEAAVPTICSRDFGEKPACLSPSLCQGALQFLKQAQGDICEGEGDGPTPELRRKGAVAYMKCLAAIMTMYIGEKGRTRWISD